jgi:hypothetical protein
MLSRYVKILATFVVGRFVILRQYYIDSTGSRELHSTVVCESITHWISNSAIYTLELHLTKKQPALESGPRLLVSTITGISIGLNEIQNSSYHADVVPIKENL